MPQTDPAAKTVDYHEPLVRHAHQTSSQEQEKPSASPPTCGTYEWTYRAVALTRQDASTKAQLITPTFLLHHGLLLSRRATIACLAIAISSDIVHSYAEKHLLPRQPQSTPGELKHSSCGPASIPNHGKVVSHAGSWTTITLA